MTSAANFDKRLMGLGSGSEFTPGLPLNTATDQIVAKAGGGQNGATILTSEINRVVTVATAADSVQLPVAVAGLSVQVTNAHASNALAIFPAAAAVTGGGLDNINTSAVNTAYSLAAGKTAFFFSAAPLVWHALLSA